VVGAARGYLQHGLMPIPVGPDTRQAGLRDSRFHDLRHHGASMALNKGFTAPIVQTLGGWKTERMMRRYAAVTDATLRAAAEAIAGTETRLGSDVTRGNLKAFLTSTSSELSARPD